MELLDAGLLTTLKRYWALGIIKRTTSYAWGCPGGLGNMGVVFKLAGWRQSFEDYFLQPISDDSISVLVNSCSLDKSC